MIETVSLVVMGMIVGGLAVAWYLMVWDTDR